MKTAIYSEKYTTNDYHTYTKQLNHPSTPHPQTAMSKKSNTMKKLQNCINSNTVQTVKMTKQNHYHFLNQFTSNSNSLSTTMTKPKKPTQKPIHNVQKNIKEHFIKEYQKIIQNLVQYYKYYQWIMTKEIEKHDAYFVEIVKIVQSQKKKTKAFLLEKRRILQEKILLQTAVLQNKIAGLENNTLKPYEKQKAELQTQKVLQIPLFEVSLKGLDKFKQQIKRFVFQTVNFEDLDKQNNDLESVADTISLQASIKSDIFCPKDFQEVFSQQIDQMTPIYPQQGQLQAKPINLLEDQDLYCDEDIQNILKDNKIMRKKKYECQQQAIPEQSESHEDSFVNSNIEMS